MNEITPAMLAALVFTIFWRYFWNGIALWRAAKHHQKKWFISLVIILPFINDLAIVPIVYLFFFSKPKFTLHEMTKWFTSNK